MKSKKTADNTIRLQKFLSDAGAASRRRAEELVEAGRVLINDEIVRRLPAFVDPRKDRVVVDGSLVRAKASEYFIVHKPKGVVCTNRDPAGRIRAVDLLPPTKGRLNVVGRLDAESTGLLLMTNDGELADKITHPRLEIPKVYRVEVRGQIPREIVGLLKKGVHLSEGKARASDVEIVRTTREMSILKITLCEGRNRQVRRMLARLDYPVKTLKRVQIGTLSLKGLPVGACRKLAARELSELRRAILAAEKRLEHSRVNESTGKRRPARSRRGSGAASKSATAVKAGKKPGNDESPPTRRRRLIT